MTAQAALRLEQRDFRMLLQPIGCRQTGNPSADDRYAHGPNRSCAARLGSKLHRGVQNFPANPPATAVMTVVLPLTDPQASDRRRETGVNKRFQTWLQARR
jgi:hypothetical protein